jgi:hypothetical protein
MTEPGLVVETELPLAWEAALPGPDAMRGCQLLLRVVNMLEGPHEGEQNRAQERLEAKLDLMLHWLGAALFASGPRLERQTARLDGHGISWHTATDSVPDQATLLLGLHPGLGAPFRTGVRLSVPERGLLRADFTDFDEVLAEQWEQWLFRLHRRAVQQDRRGSR